MNKILLPPPRKIKRVLIACECSGRVREAFRSVGCDAWSCDIKPSEDGSKFHHQGDAIEFGSSQHWDILIGHPPCTYLSFAGTRHWSAPGRCKKRLDALDFFRQLWELPIGRICLENPKGCASPTIAKYAQEIQPYEFGDSEIKTTWLWLKNLPLLVSIKGDDMFSKQTAVPIPKPHGFIKSGKNAGKKIHFTDSINTNRQTNRSRTFMGIANAMALQWGNL